MTGGDREIVYVPNVCLFSFLAPISSKMRCKKKEVEKRQHLEVNRGKIEVKLEAGQAGICSPNQTSKGSKHLDL